MNLTSKAHQLIEYCEQERSVGHIPGDFFNAASYFDTSIIINCGDIELLPKYKNINDGIIRPPFPNVALEFFGKENSAGFLFVSSIHGQLPYIPDVSPHRIFGMGMAVRFKNGWGLFAPVVVGITEDCKVSIYGNPLSNVSLSEERLNDYYLCAALWSAHIFQILHCTNIETKDNPPPLALNKKRIARGKVPLYSFKTLHIKVPNERHTSTPQGGTHASPRVHLRRGHIRRLAPGQDIWVQPCVVGSKHGLVEKDYALVAA